MCARPQRGEALGLERLLTPVVAARLDGPDEHLRARVLVQAVLGAFQLALMAWADDPAQRSIPELLHVTFRDLQPGRRAPAPRSRHADQAMTAILTPAPSTDPSRDCDRHEHCRHGPPAAREEVMGLSPHWPPPPRRRLPIALPHCRWCSAHSHRCSQCRA
ncbi:hypothetical protein [Aeromicrobium sp. UC242_57]|uniref:acyl-CoA-like ligand-binding transcription factor n=1 Tax=Aeromicrobium sp. UC242_57 TaxID=3374624 RepID=UPI00378B24D8